jgi:phosphoribosylformylglycinamidine synthase
LRIAGADGEWIIWASLVQLKEAWQKPLRMPGERPPILAKK